MAGLEDIIPGLREAGKDYKGAQMRAFIMAVDPICHVPVRPFTPQMFLELEFAGNWFVDPQQDLPSEVDIIQFIWRVSEKFTRAERGPPRAFTQFLSFADYADAVVQIRKYIKASNELRPLWPGGNGPKSDGFWVARLVHIIASEYGWPESDILSIPFCKLWQYCNRILEANSRNFVEQAPQVLALRDRWLNEQNSRN